jgi:hypothetical protein
MIGFRGAARYVAESFRDCFDLECRAIKKVRDEMGLVNVEVMIPFVRTLAEAEKVVEILAANGLKRGENGLRLIMMCELPTNAVLADKFLQFFDGFSIGSNDMTQLTLGVDRDSGGPIAATFDERNEAVKAMLHMAIQACRKADKYVGICGQGPSDHPDFRQVAGGRGYRNRLPQPGHRGGNLAVPGSRTERLSLHLPAMTETALSRAVFLWLCCAGSKKAVAAPAFAGLAADCLSAASPARSG